MRIDKEVYPPIRNTSSVMLRAERSLLDNMQTYLLQPNELQYLLQCAWVMGFQEDEKTSVHRCKFEVDLEDEEHG